MKTICQTSFELGPKTTCNADGVHTLFKGKILTFQSDICRQHMAPLVHEWWRITVLLYSRKYTTVKREVKGELVLGLYIRGSE